MSEQWTERDQLELSSTDAVTRALALRRYRERKRRAYERAVASTRAYSARELERLEAAFDEAGGRGVELAERIDALRGELGR